MQQTKPVNVIFGTHGTRLRRFLFILIVSFGVLFTACGGGGSSGSGSGDDGSNPADTGINLSDEEKLELQKSVLYTSYAGIGYSSTDDVNAPLYNVMINDLNLLVMTLAEEAFGIQSLIEAILTAEGKLAKLEALGAWWSKYFPDYGDGQLSSTWSSENEAVTITIALPDDLKAIGTTDPLRITLTADFNDTGYDLPTSPDTVTYYGNDESPDLEAYIDIVISKAGTTDIESVEITAYNTLKASYPSYDVTYGNWNISYGIDIESYLNLFLIPAISDIIGNDEGNVDNRQYTFTGEFSVDENTYITTGLTYTQAQYENDEDDISYISIDGDLTVPEADVSVGVSTPGITLQDATVIARSSDGVWTTGSMDITIGGDTTEATFDSDGSATIGSEPVDDWQTELNPL